MATIKMQNANWIAVEDYKFPGGWTSAGMGAGMGAGNAADKDARARALCRELEAGKILFFPNLPYEFPPDEREFLLSREWNELRLHKNVSYRPADDVMRGFSGDHDTETHLHHIVRNYTAHVIEFLRDFLRPTPENGNWISPASVRSRKKAATFRCTSATICCTWTPSGCGRRAAGASCASLPICMRRSRACGTRSAISAGWRKNTRTARGSGASRRITACCGGACRAGRRHWA